MPLESGQELLHYRLADRIGEGGMGAVWRARDTSLDRDVAIKVLPEAFATDADRLARFEREARLLASLNHPGIAAVFGLHEAEGQRFLAMELAPGEDLAVRLDRGPMAMDDALDAARQIAEALEAAHEAGVVHRDLKPANVVLAPDRKVKILDFGLAKALAIETTSGGDPSQSPTMTSAGTVAGVILGTAAYMSPEQARGRPVDRRADVWAFGCLLYELLCGRRAFPGETISDTLAAVLRAEPDLEALPRSTPAAVRKLLLRCLDKNPSRRLRDIGEARVALETLDEDGPREAAETAAPRFGVLLLALGGVAIAAFAAGYVVPRLGVAPESRSIDPNVRIRRVTFEPGLQYEPALSPDGNYLAYASDDRGNLDIVVQPIAGGAVQRIVATDADESQPVWSPDGSRLAYVSAGGRGGRLHSISGLGLGSAFVHGAGGGIRVVPAMGGEAIEVVEDGCQPSWSPDGGSIVFASQRDGRWNLWIVSVGDGRLRRLTDGDRIDFQPRWSPDGRWIAFARENSGATSLMVVPAEGGEPVAVLRGDELVLSPAWSPDGRNLYFSSDRAGAGGVLNLWRVPFNAEDPRIHARAQRVTLGAESDIGTHVGNEHRLAFSTARFAPDIWELTLADGSLRQVTDTPSAEDYPHLSRDGRLAMMSDRGGDVVALWTGDLDGGELTRITGPGVVINSVRWSPDGRRLAYVSIEDAVDRLVIREPGTLSVEVLREIENPVDGFVAPEWSRDGTRLAYYASYDGDSDVWIQPLDGEPRQLTFEGRDNMFPTWSPDDATIAFQREDGGQRQIWTVPAEGGEPTRLTRDDEREFSHPQWSPVDPDRILVVLDHEGLAIVSASTGEYTTVADFETSRWLVDYPSWSHDGARVYFSVARQVGAVYLLEGF